MEFWNDLKPKGKICIVLFVPLAIAFVALFVRQAFAGTGCATAVGFWGYAGNGTAALIFGVFLAAIAAWLFRAIIGIPEIVGSARRRLAERREYRQDMKDRGWPVPSIMDNDNLRETACLLLFFLAAALVVLMLGAGVGYIAWLLSC
jgi:hypothetical protein